MLLPRTSFKSGVGGGRSVSGRDINKTEFIFSEAG